MGKTRSCAGISGKSQILFLVVFVTRYLDLVTNFVSLYNTTMKIFFICSAAATVYLMYFKFKATYDGNHDTFRVEFLLAPTALLAGPQPRLQCDGDPVDLLHLPGECRHPAPAVHGEQDWRGGDHHQPLSLRSRLLPRPLHLQLDLEILQRVLL